ncbi:hypothetical protein K502DRAFT_309329 [Neoconidiobolus thromboides FSU 785]|nr:hypothetical protein K502DRAFT_309329 [Neoconidiobolus thromboides FSU 785]
MSKPQKNNNKVDPETNIKTAPETNKRNSFLRRGSRNSKDSKEPSLSVTIDPKSKKENGGGKKGFSRLLTPKYYEIKALALSKVEEKKSISEHTPILSDKKKPRDNSKIAKVEKDKTENKEKVDVKSIPKVDENKDDKNGYLIADSNNSNNSNNKVENVPNSSPADVLLKRNTSNGSAQSSIPVVGLSDIMVSSTPSLSPNNISSTSQLNELISSRSPSPVLNSNNNSNDVSFNESSFNNSANLNSSANSMLIRKSLASTLGTGSSISLKTVSTIGNPKGWEKVYQFFTGWVNKNKKGINIHRIQIEKRGKRLNSTRLKTIKENIENSKDKFLSHTEDSFINYAPLFVLKLVSLMFSEEIAKFRLETESKMVWGIRRKNCIEYVEIDAPWENQCGKRMIGQELQPNEYISRVVKECWKSILKIGKVTNCNKEELKVERRKGLWFLKQFCIIYGFGVVKLGMVSQHMLPQLEMIATLPELFPIQNFIEDTIYGLNKQENIRGKHIRRMPSYVIRSNMTTRRPPAPGYHMHHRKSSSALKSSPLTPTHVSSNSNSNSQSYSYGLQTQEGSGITLERLILYLTESLTKINSPSLSTKLFSQLVHEVPKGASIVDSFHRGEINLCCDYLLSYDFVISPNRWFRESCDQKELSIINQDGFIAYLDKLETDVDHGKIRSINLINKSIASNHSKHAKLDPRLVASHLKHVISQHGGLISIPIAHVIIELVGPTMPSRTKSHPNVTNCEAYDGHPNEERNQFIRSLLLLSPFQFNMIQKVIQVSQRIFEYYNNYDNDVFTFQTTRSNTDKEGITPQELAIVLPVIPAHLLPGVQCIKQWNYAWGKLLENGSNLFLDPTLNGLSLIPIRLSKGFQSTLEILQASGIKFLS